MAGISRRAAVRAGAAVVLLAAIAGIWFSPIRELLTLEQARLAMDTVASLWWGPAAFILAFAVLATLLVPATLFVVSASLIWGWVSGGIYSVTGATLGALLSFAIGRWMGADALHRLGDRGARAAEGLKNAGFGTMLILRLVPLFPFAVLNYGAGLAGLRPRDFVAATAIGTAPSIFIIAYSADAIVGGTLSGEEAFGRILTAGLLLAALAVIPMVLRRRAGKSLRIEAE